MSMPEIEPITIGAKRVGPGHGVYVIAEAGVNHNGDVGRAKAMCEAARDAGADAVKFQAFRSDALVSADAPLATYQRKGAKTRRTQREMLRALELSPDALACLAEHCRASGIEFLATPFDEDSLELLVRLGVTAIKIASPDVVDEPLVRAAARTGLPLIISTGAAQVTEIDEALGAAHEEGCTEVVLLHCVSVYPTPFEVQNLKAIRTLMELFSCVGGYSDHSMELLSGRLAVTLGASVLEKHFTLSRKDEGPDHAMSLEPPQLAKYIAMAREMPADLIEIVENNERSQLAIGHGFKVPHSLEDEVRRLCRKSLAARCDIREGEAITREMLTTMRPGTGIPPTLMDEVLGAVAAEEIAAGTILTPEMLGAGEGDDEGDDD